MPSPDARPNIVLICVDQMRGDALSAAGHPVVRTPWIDSLAAQGTRFEHAYSATPTCVPARVALFTGKAQENHGRVGYSEGVPFQEAHPVTMQGCLGEAGYQTQAIGKMHVYPERARCGFDNVTLHDGFLHFARQHGDRHLEANDDYLRWLRRQPGMADADHTDHGVGCNSHIARPWDKPEAYHPTTWAVTEAIDFLDRRDPTVPFFLYLSFHRPHAPHDPPAYAFDQYRDAEMPEPPVGDWVDAFADHRKDFTAEGEHGAQHPDMHRRAVAGYYGNITHIDNQLNRFLEALSDHRVLANTAFVFVSDHGDMMGDHHFYRKTVPYEGSARVPFLVTLPGGRPARPVADEVVELRDVLPTVLDIAGVPCPDGVDGRSVLPLMESEAGSWRDDLHGEHVHAVFGWQSVQWVTDGRRKFIWWSGSGLEQFFDLEADPQECHDLTGDPARADEVAQWRSRLVEHLRDREEGFVDGDSLVVGRPVHAELSWVRELKAARAAGS
ncbi:arylsulfatase [Aestuariimicrobium soli]|uniref:arylsulfatase n=1 Tax=Aestuariimicrobium soli TaxID=2035834 RepID=UPI003EBBFC53